MSSLLDGIDVTDPCALWPVLQLALDKLLLGESAVRTRFGEDEVQFQQANIAALQNRIRELKLECEKKNGRVRRHAIRAGFRHY